MQKIELRMYFGEFSANWRGRRWSATDGGPMTTPSPASAMIIGWSFCLLGKEEEERKEEEEEKERKRKRNKERKMLGFLFFISGRLLVYFCWVCGWIVGAKPNVLLSVILSKFSLGLFVFFFYRLAWVFFWATE